MLLAMLAVAACRSHFGSRSISAVDFCWTGIEFHSHNAMKGAMLLAMLAVGALGMEVSVTSSLSFDAAEAKNRPVSKVITLLKDMLKQLEKEAEEDEEIYDKMACWCETNDKEKTKSIADAEARISDLTTKIEELTASSARLNTEIKNLEKEVAENQEALDAATAIRTKQLAEFNGAGAQDTHVGCCCNFAA